MEHLPPNKALAAFSPFIGNWTTEGSHGMIKDTVLHGQTSFEWHESQAYIMVRSSIAKKVGIPVGMAVIASDDELGTYALSYYDERGVSRLYQITLEGNVLRWWRDAPSFSQRYTLTIAEDGQTIVGKGEICQDGTNWEKDLDLTYRKATT